MKKERLPHHTPPLMREDPAMTNGGDLTDCMRKLTLKNVPPDSKDKYILAKEIKKEEDLTANDKKKEIKIEAKDDDQEVPEKPTTKKDNTKEKEKPKVKEEPLGELCARGPDGRCKSTSQSRVSSSPYIPHTQKNTTLTNGGHYIYNPPQTELCSEIHYSHPSINHHSELPHEYYRDQYPSVTNDSSQYIRNIHEYPLEVTECPDFQPNVLSPAKPDPQSDLDGVTLEMIKAVTEDPVRCEKVYKDLQQHLQEGHNIPEPPINHSPYGSYGRQSPDSSPQVVPKFSSCTTNFGSPPGPSSPNQYATTPTFSPNVPSPRGYMSDDSSTHMYTYSPTMNHPYPQLDPINLDDICADPPEDKRSQVRQLVQELDNTCSQACSRPEPGNPPLNLPVNGVGLTTSPLVIATLIPAPSPTSKASSNHGPRLRLILPKPCENTKPLNQGDTIPVQNSSSKQNVNNNRMVLNQKKHVLTARERLHNRCSLEKVNQSYMTAQDVSDDKIGQADNDGDTPLMITICNTDLPKKPEQLYALGERCKKLPEVLNARNLSGHSALYMACMVHHGFPLVGEYIAEIMINAGIDMNEANNDMGSTLLHLLCEVGDKCAEVLDKILSLRDQEGRQCFDINKYDYEGMTPLHVAIKKHSELPSLQLINVLLKHGADVLKEDRKQGSNSLHFAVATDKPDINLINILCDPRTSSKDLVNAVNYRGDTPLHVAMAYGGGIDQLTHNAILECLRSSGASRAIRNQNGKAPLELAPEPRKVEIKKILDKYNIK